MTAANGPQAARVRTVSQVTERVRRLFDADPELFDVWVEGEVSNFRPAASGHWYWTLKDGEAALRCVMWKARALAQSITPEDGGSIVVHGAISVYAAQGQYQLYADYCQAAGQGELFLAFERLKAKLEAEGLFAPARKRPLPRYPRRIGVVTSPDAAALRDVCQVLARRWPGAEVLVAPTLVQGEAAPARIAAALGAAGRAGVDVVLLVRGGGSIEDLWAFNDEGVARAVAACPVPVVSGVGHETDVTIVDFVADVRAATPSAAAEMCAPDGRDLAMAVDQRRERLGRSMAVGLRSRADGVAGLRARMARASPLRAAAAWAMLVSERRLRLARALTARARLAAADLAGLERRLAALSPAATMARGYSHVSRRADGRPVRSVADAEPGAALRVRVCDGAYHVVVEGQARLLPKEEG